MSTVAAGRSADDRAEQPRASAGLSDEEVERRLAEFGPNELSVVDRAGFTAQLRVVMREPMLLILLLVSATYLVIGNLGEGLSLVVSALLIVAIAVYQNRKAESALQVLRDLSSPRALVVRNGQERRIAARDLVPGDLVLLREGDRVPADGSLVEANNLKIDESLLTGEAGGVFKSANGAKPEPVLMSTLVVAGRARMRVERTGRGTEVGKLGEELKEESSGQVALLRQVRGIVNTFAIIGGTCCLLVALLYAIRRNDWQQGVLGGLATAMALLPEEFPVVVSVFLAFGSWRLSRVAVLVRQSAAIERLGAITILCADKTGTMTKNEMHLHTVHGTGGSMELSGAVLAAPAARELVEAALLASPPNSFDPMEKGIAAAAAELGIAPPAETLRLEREYPLTERRFAMSFVWRRPSGLLIGRMKGAPEAVLELCRLEPARAAQITGEVRALAAQGMRLLGVARAEAIGTELPQTQEGLPWEWIGLLGFVDPVREQVPAAIEQCRRAGIRVMMITGDHPETARQVARTIGLSDNPLVLEGHEVAERDAVALAKELHEVNVFARMRPEQKLKIVSALQASGEVVGMTGDGVNDAPCLKRADVGIAMGARGTDVAREAAPLVLLDDNFGSIVAGIERGRTIYLNLQKSLSYVISIHVPLAGLAVFPLLLGWEPLLFPIHIALLQLIIDPSCSLLFEAQEADEGVMRRPPRQIKDPLLERSRIIRSLAQGCVLFFPVALLYFWELRIHGNASIARASAVLALVLGNLALIFADLSMGRSADLRAVFQHARSWLLLGAAACFLLVAGRVPAVATALHFRELGWDDLARAMATGIAVFFAVYLWNALALRRAE